MRARLPIEVAVCLASGSLLMACGSASSLPMGATSTSTSSISALAGAIPATSRESAQLTSAYVVFRSFPSSAIAPVSPSAVRLAYVPSQRTYWAVASFSTAPQATLRVRIGMQDGASSGLFVDRAGAGWKVVTIGPRCGLMLQAPPAVRSALGLAAVCPPTG